MPEGHSMPTALVENGMNFFRHHHHNSNPEDQWIIDQHGLRTVTVKGKMTMNFKKTHRVVEDDSLS